MTKKKFISLVFLIFSFVFFASHNISFADDTGTSNYNTDQYRIYNTKGYPDFDDKFHISPIKYALQSNSGSTAEQYENLRMELAKTGYEAYCLAEKVKIEPQYSTTKLIETYLEQYPNGRTMNTFSKEILGMEDANYPIWRDVADKQFLMTSLEEYFGFKDLYEEDPAKTEINTAAINSLLSQEQSCVQGWITLGTERRACNRLQDPSTCAFTKRKIPGSGYEVHDIMGMLSDFTGGNWAGGDQKRGEELAIKWCDVIFSEPIDPKESTLNAVQKELLKPIKNTIINVPFYMDRGYRYGFIVAAVETRIPEKTSDTEAGLIFNFFTKKTEKNQKDEVLVAAFKLPDIGTNKGYGSAFGHDEWDDPLDLSRLVLTTDEAHNTHEVDRLEKRNQVLSAAIAAEAQSQGSRIFCCTGALPGSGCTNTCQLPLPKALTDIINGNAEACETKAEVVNEIRDLAGLRDASDLYGKLFKKENGGQVLINLFLGSIYNKNKDVDTPDHAETNPGDPKIESIWTIKEPPWPPKTGNSYVHFYLVYPVGFELKTVEEAIKGAFFTEAQIAEMNMDESIVNNFEVTGQNQSLQGGSVGWTFVDKVRTANFECGEYEDEYGNPTGVPKPCREHPNIGIKQDSGKIDVLGGRLSWWLRKIQVALSPKFSVAHTYYQSCKTMEEFLLGKCGGSVTGGPVDPKEAVAVAQCISGGPRITSGETAEHVPAPGAPGCYMYDSSIHSIPSWFSGGDSAPTCDEAFYSYIACTYPNTLIANPVNSEGEFVTSGDMTACEFVVSRAKELGISPRFALAMWGEETGFSHYRSSFGAFGIHPGVAKPLHLGEQLAALYGTMYHWKSSYQNFLEAYSAEVKDSNQFCTNPEFPARLATYYYYLSP